MKTRSVLTALAWSSAILLLFFFPSMVSSDYWVTVFINIIINILLAASLRTIMLVGHISLGHVGFMAMGAYCSALLVMKAGFPFAAAFFCAGLLPATIAFMIGYPFLRVKGVYFAILTLLTGQIIRLVAYSWADLTGGQLGLIGIPAVGGFESTLDYFYLYAGIVTIGLAVLSLLERSELGR